MLSPVSYNLAPELDNDAFAQDAYDLFMQRRSGHMSKWLYSTPHYEGDKAAGANAFVRAVKEAQQGSPYYVFLKEREVITQFSKKASSLFSASCRLIDLGPGSADAVNHKVVPLIQAAAGHIKEYVCVDVCDATLEIAETKIKEAFPFIQTKKILKDFVQDAFRYGDSFAQEVSTMFGLTLCNMAIDPRVQKLPEYQLASWLGRLKSHLSAPDGYLLITQDTNQDERSLKEAYFALEEHYQSIWHRIGRDLNVVGDYDPNKFVMDVEFIPETQACTISAVASDTMIFSLNGKIVTIKEGDRFYFHNAFKFDEETFLKAAKTAGFHLEHTETVSGNPCVLHVLKSA